MTLQSLGMFVDLFLVMITFGLIITIHELGHFIAAKWARVRVLAFAVGFGPAIGSYRKGIGFRRGSSEQEYLSRLAKSDTDGISPTEYRLNALPLGGYVKMLGQDDMRPGAQSAERDSYQSVSPLKRMVIISAGVVFNIITAAILFVIVFTLGLKTEAPVIGMASASGPAATATLDDADRLGIAERGLRSGDRVLAINSDRIDTFTDVIVGVAMSAPGEEIKLRVARPGYDEPLFFRMTPQKNRLAGRLDIEVQPSASNTLGTRKSRTEREEINEVLAKSGLDGVQAGMRLVRANGVEVHESAFEAVEAFRASGGRAVELEFVGDSGATVTVSLAPQAETMRAEYNTGGKNTRNVSVEHLLGFTPVMAVSEPDEGGKAAGLEAGDIFARIGDVEYPDLARGISEIRSHAGGPIDIVVLRGDGPIHDRERVPLTARVNKDGTIGFGSGDTSGIAVMLAAPLPGLSDASDERVPNLAPSLDLTGGSIVRSVDGIETPNFSAFREALARATRDTSDGGSVELSVLLPDGSTRNEKLDLSRADIESLRALGWTAPDNFVYLFQPRQILLKASGPLDAMAMGLRRTKSAMTLTYLTFVRLFQGTVAVENLKGPVGIAHIGTLVAARGFVWLMFFAALISVNLAVINFLPLPIVDGGQFLYAVYEQVTGKPVPVQVQNAAALAGLVLIAAIFLFVTFNDIRNLLG